MSGTKVRGVRRLVCCPDPPGEEASPLIFLSDLPTVSYRWVFCFFFLTLPSSYLAPQVDFIAFFRHSLESLILLTDNLTLRRAYETAWQKCPCKLYCANRPLADCSVLVSRSFAHPPRPPPPLVVLTYSLYHTRALPYASGNFSFQEYYYTVLHSDDVLAPCTCLTFSLVPLQCSYHRFVILTA